MPAELAVHGSSALQPVEAGQPLTARQLTARLAVIQDVMKNVMKDGPDFGTIPGTQKPTLYKPGAEKLCVTFRLTAADPLIEQVPELGGDIRYRVRVPIQSADGNVLAVGIGECSTGEEKYRWRRPVHENEYNAADADRKREKWQKNGDVWRQVRVEPADVANTVLKMAHKRAYIHGVIMATAAGAIFTQDIEDLPEGLDVGQNGNGSAKQAMQPPQRRAAVPAPSAAGPAGAGTTVRLKVVGEIDRKTGTNAQGEWVKFTITGSDRQKYGTFDTKHYDTAKEAQEAGLEVDITYTAGKYGRDIASIALVESPATTTEREPGAEG